MSKVKVNNVVAEWIRSESSHDSDVTEVMFRVLDNVDKDDLNEQGISLTDLAAAIENGFELINVK